MSLLTYCDLLLHRWVPPLMTSASEQTHQTAAQRGGLQREKDKPLSDTQRDRFEDLLRSLTMERVDIRAGMVFALDNADSATEVSSSLRIHDFCQPCVQSLAQ